MADNFFIVLFMVYLFGCDASAVDSRKVVIDHDGGADDAFAITLSLLNEKYFNGPKLVALTTTFGNVNLNQTIINTDRLLTLCDRQDIPVYSGAYKALIAELPTDQFFGNDGLGDDGYTSSTPIKLQKEPAAVALLELSKKYEGELVIVAIGPLTNIALAIRLDPQFIHRLAHLYVGAGNIYSKQHRKAEFNAYMDPEAYHIVADAATVDKVTFIPYSMVKLTLKICLEWRKNVLGNIQTPLMQALNGFERISLAKQSSWTLLDPAVMAISLYNELAVDTITVNNDIILEGGKRGINTNDFSSKTPNGKIVREGNVERYKSLLLALYSAEQLP